MVSARDYNDYDSEKPNLYKVKIINLAYSFIEKEPNNQSSQS